MEQDYSKERELLDRFNRELTTQPENAQVNHAFNEFTKSTFDHHSSTEIEKIRNKIWAKLPAAVTQPSTVTKKLWPRIVTIAAAVTFIVSGIYFYNSNNLINKENPRASAYTNDIAPGTNKAVLTLANGKKISLSNMKSGLVIKASELTYDDGTAIQSVDTKRKEFSTISTPRGGQYNVELPDGTIVALNAASTLKFPSTFLGLVNRTVELVGEGYFRVTKDKKHPFIVKSAGQLVEVLGTHFNLNSYPDEAGTKTTLIEGSVKVSANGKSRILKPNQQSLATDEQINVRYVDPEEAIAWKNGLFIFDNEPLESILRKVQRWYNVEVVYADDIPNDTYMGSVSRFDNVSKVLHILESTGSVHFKIEGRRITVLK